MLPASEFIKIGLCCHLPVFVVVVTRLDQDPHHLPEFKKVKIGQVKSDPDTSQEVQRSCKWSLCRAALYFGSAVAFSVAV